MVSEARRLAAQTFGSWGMDAEQVELACLLVSEVVTNAVLHASITPSPGRRPDFDFDLDPVIMSAPVGSPRTPEPVPAAGPRSRPAAVKAAAAPVRVSGPGLPVQGGAVPGWDDPVPEAGRIGPREFALRLRRGANAVWVEVFDPDLRLPRIRTAAETDEGGRGLYLVEQLATRWGSRPTADGKAVWFEMPRSGYRP
jgi:anti-sigma regulatory factor (Ser/Thr protein kinase)